LGFELEKVAKRWAGYLPPWLLQPIIYYRHHGRFPHLRNPRTFTEKIQWRKIHDRNPKFPVLADKLASKAFVGGHIDSEWVVPTLWSGTGTAPEVLAGLTRPFVIKPTHSTAPPVFVGVEGTDFNELARRCNRWLKLRHARQSHEWGYYGVPAALIAEPVLGGDPADPPRDYKLYVFSGRVEFIHVDTDRFRGHKRAYFDREWRPIELKTYYEVERRPVEPPPSLAAMIAFAERLAPLVAPDFMRIDLYDVDARPYFGEATFYPDSGYLRFEPVEMDLRFGELWQLPQTDRP
jgi:hypothetical protein